MDRPIVACVLAGGIGTRLYPASRRDRPKQLLALGGERSLLARTVERARFADETYVLTRERFAEQVREHAPDAAMLVEPEPKDTGPALIYATARIREQVGECVVLALPSDHHIAGAFEETATRAAEAAAETSGLVTVGVAPTRPATGYGYLELGAERGIVDGPGNGAEADREGGTEDGGGSYYEIARFHEKPDRETAARYVREGHRWNAGIFAWTPAALLDAARKSPLAALVAALDGGNPDDVGDAFAAVEPVSVDRAVLERTGAVFCVPADFEWDDLGTWDALARVGEADEDDNVVLGDALTLDATDNVVASGDTHVSLAGVEGLAVAAYDDRVLVVPRGEAQRVREVAAELRKEGRF
ncbi:mannose-1-phosphate guanyltransferase [Halobacteriales archaeon QS_4_69_34]|nr:MAG: mannose-1-phosphate guanyltransferase [Halobacteriales archaeon QS_4_69_34]